MGSTRLKKAPTLFAAACVSVAAMAAAVCSASEPAAELGREAVFLQERMAIGDVSLGELREAQVRVAALGRLAGRDVSKLVEAIATARDGLSVRTHPDCAAARAAGRATGRSGNAQGADSAKTCEWLLRPVFDRAGLPAPSAEALLAGADLKPLLNAVSRRSGELLRSLGPPGASGPYAAPGRGPD